MYKMGNTQSNTLNIKIHTELYEWEVEHFIQSKFCNVMDQNGDRWDASSITNDGAIVNLTLHKTN